MKERYFNKKTDKRRGFTLVEVLVGGVLIMALAVGVVGLQYILGQSQVLVWQNYMNVDQANANIRTMVRELRTARQGDDGSYTLVSALDQEIIFYSDIDYDTEAERVRYRLEGFNFIKGVIEPEGYPPTYLEENEKAWVVTENVRNYDTPVFTYYNGDWPADTDTNPLPEPIRLSETKLIKVHLRLNTRADQPSKDYLLESYVQVRMLKENL